MPTRYEQNREKLLAYQNEYYKTKQTTEEYREKRKAYMKQYHQRKKEERQAQFQTQEA
jgi:hypothetical protein